MEGMKKTPDGFFEISDNEVSNDFIAFFDQRLGIVDKSTITFSM